MHLRTVECTRRIYKLDLSVFLVQTDNMGTERGFESSWKDDLHLLPFEGTVDFHRFAQQIRDCGYNGSLMLEIGCNPMAPVTLPVEEYLAKAAESARRLRKLIDG